MHYTLYISPNQCCLHLLTIFCNLCNPFSPLIALEAWRIFMSVARCCKDNRDSVISKDERKQSVLGQGLKFCKLLWLLCCHVKSIPDSAFGDFLLRVVNDLLGSAMIDLSQSAALEVGIEVSVSLWKGKWTSWSRQLIGAVDCYGKCLGIPSHTAIHNLNELSCFYMTYLYSFIHCTFMSFQVQVLY